MSHINAVKDILQYLKGTTSYGLLLSGKGNDQVEVYTDKDWAGCVDDRKSVSGCTLFMNKSLVAWHSKKQSVVALSSMEAEYITMSHSLQEALWLHSLIREFQQLESKIVYQSAIEISKNNNKHSGAKHIDIHYHFIRDCLQKEKVKL
jgi:hypothetical protein